MWIDHWYLLSQFRNPYFLPWLLCIRDQQSVIVNCWVRHLWMISNQLTQILNEFRLQFCIFPHFLTDSQNSSSPSSNCFRFSWFVFPSLSGINWNNTIFYMIWGRCLITGWLCIFVSLSNKSPEVDHFFVKNTEFTNQDSLDFIINRWGSFVGCRLFIIWFTSECFSISKPIF